MEVYNYDQKESNTGRNCSPRKNPGDAYEKDRIRTVAHNTTGDTCDVVYRFNYDGLGRKTSVQAGNATSQTKTLSTNVYSDDRSGLLTQVEYGNSGKVKYGYDDFDRLTGVSYDSETTPRYSYTYDASGEVAKVTDHHLNRTVETERDLAFRPRQNTLKDAGGNTLYRTTLYYDGRNRLEKFAERLGSADYATAYAYDKDRRTTQITFSETSGGVSGKLTYAYDALGRARTRTATIGSNNYTTTYGYAAGDASLYGTNATTPLVASITQGSGANAMNFAYTYDSRGNIVSETRNGKVTTYAYDALGQLVRVNDPHENATWVYNYDRGGNITSKVRYAYTTGTLGTAQQTIPYVYGDSTRKDKLTKYNGKTITYDAIGNPLNDGERSYTWDAGR